MDEVYVIDYMYTVEDYDGRSRTETYREEDTWFPSEDDALEHMREKGWRTKGQEEERLLARSTAEYEKALRAWSEDDRGYRAALAAGVSPRLVTKPYRPQKPTCAHAESWYEVTRLERFHKVSAEEAEGS